MAIMQGITGKLSGKMGSAVFRTRKGAQVVSQYNPIVSNPKSKAQSDQRAKFKLASQLAAELAPNLAFNITARAGHGSTTQRNEFVKANLPLINIVEANETQEAKVALVALKLTNSQRSFNANVSAIAQTSGTTVEVKTSFIITDPTITAVEVVIVGIAQTRTYDGYGAMSILTRPERKVAGRAIVREGRAEIILTYELDENQQLEGSLPTVLTYGISPTSEMLNENISNAEAEITDNMLIASNSIDRELRNNNLLVTETKGVIVTLS